MYNTQVKSNIDRFHYFNVIIVSIISGFFVFIWIASYEFLNNVVWNNNYILENRWIIPAVSITFSLIVGLMVKYLQAPTCLSGSLLDSMSGGGEKIDWRNLPTAILMSLVSLLSGAVVGPEGAIGHFSLSIAAWFSEKFKIKKEDQDKIIYASLASAYNGLIESPIFTAVLSNDISENKKDGLINLPSNLIAGTIGYLIFTLLGSPGLTNYLDLSSFDDFKGMYILYVIIFAFVGIALGVYMGIIFKIIAKIFSKFNDKIITRALIAGVIFGITGYFLPIIMFSGETQIHTIVANPAQYGILILFAMALLKIILLAVSFKSGFLGGPTFPVIFSATTIALAISLIFPQLPLTLILAGIISSALMMLFKTPFMVILLTAIFLSADTNLIALIIVAVATVMIIAPQLEKLKSKKS